MKVFITGGTGQLGRFLVEKCVEKGYEVTVLANRRNIENPKANYLYGNLTKYTVDDFVGLITGCNVVINIAAEISIPDSYSRPELYFETNTMSVLRLARACMAAGIEKFVQTSTSETYGTAQNIPITENHLCNPQSPYAASKAATDYMLKSFVKSYDFNAVILRPFNFYSEYQSQKALIPSLAVQMITKDVIKVGSLDTRRDLTHASDTAEAYIKVIEKVDFTAIKGQELNVCSGNCILGNDILLAIQNILGKEVKVEQDPARMRPRDSEVQILKGDYSRIHLILGWKPEIQFFDGLKRTVEYIKEHINEYAPDKYVI